MQIKISSIIALFISSFLFLETPLADTLKDQLKNLQPYKIDYPSYGLSMGNGWDQFLGRRTPNTCVEFSETSIENNSFATDVRVIKNSYDLRKSQFAKLSGSLNLGFIKARASASTDRQEKINRDSVNILSEYKFTTGSTKLEPVRSLGAEEELRLSENELAAINRGGTIQLTQYAKNILKRGKSSREERAREFRRLCGTGFVAAIDKGIRISVLASRVVESRSQKEKLEASARASGWGVKLRGEVKEEQDEVIKNSRLRFTVAQSGGSQLVSISKDFNPETFHENLDIAAAYQNPAAFSATIFPYSAISSVPSEVAISDFPMEGFNKAYYFLIDAEESYNKLSEGIYQKLYQNNSNTSIFLYSKLSMHVVGGESAVLANRSALRNTKTALIQALEQCYLAVSSISSAKCNIEDSFIEALEITGLSKFILTDEIAKNLENVSGEELLQEFANYSMDTGSIAIPYKGLSFLQSLDGQQLLFNEKMNFVRNPESTKEKQKYKLSEENPEVQKPTRLEKEEQIKLQNLVSTIFNYYLALPLKSEDLSIEKAATDLNVQAHLLWSKEDEKSNEAAKKTNDTLREYIKNQIFYIRLLPLREELCLVSTEPTICLPDTMLFSKLDRLNFEFDDDFFPKEAPPPAPPPRRYPPTPSCPYKIGHVWYQCP